MPEQRVGKVRGLFRYPVKGLSAEALERVAVEAGGTMPFDPAWAIENGPGRFDPDQPKHLPKIHFLMLMRNERLATLETRFDDANQTLTILRAGKQVARGELATKLGRTMVWVSSARGALSATEPAGAGRRNPPRCTPAYPPAVQAALISWKKSATES